jgi:3-hydroxyacyl-CoA dehydrogenase
VTSLAVIGARSMGAQIAQQAALNGVDVAFRTLAGKLGRKTGEDWYKY